METYKDYIARKSAETQEQLRQQSAKSADAAASAMASAAAAGMNMHAEATSGGMMDSDVKPKEVTAAQDTLAKQENPQPSTQGPTDKQPEYSADDNARMTAIANDVIGQQTQEEQPKAEQPAAEPATNPFVNNPDEDVVTGPDGKLYKKLPDGTLAQLNPETKGEPADSGNQQPDVETEPAGEESQQVKLFSDLINEHTKYKQQQEEEMKAQEKANTISTMATGATELAAGIINMLSVGEGHASNQQYRSYAQDWMRKAEHDLREHRNRREDLQATLDRLRMQKQQVQNAERLEDIKASQRRAEEERKAAEEENNRKIREQKIKDDRDADMLLRGFVPDESAPGGYRFDPNLAAQIAGAKKGSAASGSKVKTETGQDAGQNKTDSGSSGEKKTDYAAQMANSMANGWAPKQPGVGVLAPDANGNIPTQQKPAEKKTKSLADELRGN